MARTIFLLALALPAAWLAACGPAAGSPAAPDAPPAEMSQAVRRVVEDAVEQTGYTVSYDPAYVRLDYPNGDVPRDRGVCTDVVVRAFRKAGVDLQKEVHEDMRRDFAAYPKLWGLKRPDPNIDHRRVPNLMTFFKRRGKSLAVTREAARYRPGDVVAWRLDNGLPHIGLVTDRRAAGGGRFLIVHNIGAGARLEDVLLSWQIIGHYRFFAD